MTEFLLDSMRQQAWREMESAWGHSSAGRAPALHAGGRRFEPAWLHHVVPGQVEIRLQLREFLILSIIPVTRNAGPETSSAKCPDLLGRLFFNNMRVLSRAFWVQNDSECVCDEHAIFRNEHKTVSAKQI